MWMKRLEMLREKIGEIHFFGFKKIFFQGNIERGFFLKKCFYNEILIVVFKKYIFNEILGRFFFKYFWSGFFKKYFLEVSMDEDI